MTLGQRCDEIIRLIDEGLAGVSSGDRALAPPPFPAPVRRAAERPAVPTPAGPRG